MVREGGVEELESSPKLLGLPWSFEVDGRCLPSMTQEPGDVLVVGSVEESNDLGTVAGIVGTELGCGQATGNALPHSP